MDKIKEQRKGFVVCWLCTTSWKYPFLYSLIAQYVYLQQNADCFNALRLSLQEIVALLLLDCQHSHKVSIPKMPLGTNQLTVSTKWSLQQVKMHNHSDKCTSHHQDSQLSILKMMGLTGCYPVNEGLNHAATEQAQLAAQQTFWIRHSGHQLSRLFIYINNVSRVMLTYSRSLWVPK